MASDQSFSTQDLRAHSVDYNRDHSNKAKWAYGQSFGPGRRTDEGHARPARPHVREAPGIRRDGTPVSTHKQRARVARKLDAGDHQYVSGESGTEEDEPIEPSAAPEPDAEIAYSYDAHRGPSEGSQILGAALDKAIERFEVRATDKLIKEEYEVLDSLGEPVVKGKGKKAAVAEEEDYEIV